MANWNRYIHRVVDGCDRGTVFNAKEQYRTAQGISIVKLLYGVRNLSEKRSRNYGCCDGKRAGDEVVVPQRQGCNSRLRHTTAEMEFNTHINIAKYVLFHTMYFTRYADTWLGGTCGTIHTDHDFECEKLILKLRRIKLITLIRLPAPPVIRSMYAQNAILNKKSISIMEIVLRNSWCAACELYIFSI